MGGAMLRAASRVYGAGQFLAADALEENRSRITAETGVKVLSENRGLARESRYLILAVKPQIMPEVLEEIKTELSEGQIIISVAAGVTIAQLKAALGAQARIVRAMPNTAAMVGEAMSGVCFEGSAFQPEEKETVMEFFRSFGRAAEVPERLLNAVICASGSSPAYVYMFIESLADSAVRAGLPRKQALEMAAQGVLGAAKMVLETGKHPGELKDAVCSPGGTTIEGVAALEEFGLRGAVMKAGERCLARAEALSQDK